MYEILYIWGRYYDYVILKKIKLIFQCLCHLAREFHGLKISNVLKRIRCTLNAF